MTYTLAIFNRSRPTKCDGTNTSSSQDSDKEALLASAASGTPVAVATTATTASTNGTRTMGPEVKGRGPRWAAVGRLDLAESNYLRFLLDENIWLRQNQEKI